jgi:hypothetical protein
MLRPSSMEAKQTLKRATSVALYGLWLVLLPMFAGAGVSQDGSMLAAVLLSRAPNPKKAPPAASPGSRWRKSAKDSMALGADTVHLRAWKLLPVPLAQTGTAEVPEHSEDKLDALVEQIEMQPVRYYLPKAKASFQSFDMREHYPNAKESIGYALTSIAMETPTTATLQLRSANSVRIWINGELVLTQTAPKFGKAITMTAEIALDTEENIILVECLQDGKNWGFSLGVGNLEKTELLATNRNAKP